MQSKNVENVGMIYFSDHFPFVREISMILYFGRKSIKTFRAEILTIFLLVFLVETMTPKGHLTDL